MWRPKAHHPPPPKPAIFSLGGLILLPVVIIAAVAISTIIQNRADVEREARRQAEEVARQYGKKLERSWGGSLMSLEFCGWLWRDYLALGVGSWPVSVERMLWDAPRAAQFQARLREWQAQ